MVGAIINASDFTCKNAMAGVGCNVPEMLTLGIVFFLGSILCISLLVHHILLRKSRNRSPFDFSILFYATTAIYMLFKAAISIIPFNYSIFTWNIISTNINAILFAIPLSLVILILCNILFTYRNPGTKMIIFFKMLFFLFLIAFLLIAVVIAITYYKYASEHSRIMKLWRACTDLLICVFFAGPAIQLIQELALKSTTENRETKYLAMSILGVGAFSVIVILRIVYNITGYFNINPIEHYIQHQIDLATRLPNEAARAFSVFYYFLFDCVGALIGIAAVFFVEKKDLTIYTDPNYHRQLSDSGID